MIIETVWNFLSNLLFFALHLSNASSFPPPLYTKEEKECLIACRNGDTEANNLIEHNLRLVAHIIKKRYSNSAQQDDLISIGTIGLSKQSTHSMLIKEPDLLHMPHIVSRNAYLSYENPNRTSHPEDVLNNLAECFGVKVKNLM